MILRSILYFSRTNLNYFNPLKIVTTPSAISSLFKRTFNQHQKHLRFGGAIGTSFAFVTLVHNLGSLPEYNNEKMVEEQQTLENLLQNADQLFDENHFQENIDLLDKYSDKDLPDIEWRKARAIYSVAKAVKNSAEKAKLIRQSYELINSAVTKDESNFAIHKWYSIILDANAELDGIKARVSQLEVVKKHMLKAIELNPQDPTSWYILGAFEFNLAELPWIQRKIVSTIFATPPTGTYEQALEYLEKAETIKEGFYSMNWLMLAKCHLALKNTEKAKQFLEKAANCHVLNEDDKNCKEEACKLLKKM